MSKTKVEYARINAKMTSAKGSVTRSCNTLKELCIQLENLLNQEEKDLSDKANKIAEEIDKTRGSIEQHIENLENTGKQLTEVIAGMKAEDTMVKNLEKMAAMVNDDIEDYISKYDELKTEHSLTLEATDKLVSPVQQTQVYQKRTELLTVKRNQIKHTEFLIQLENLMSVAEFENMTSDELIIHIFTETADATMSKIGIEILKNDQPSVTELMTRIIETENAMQGMEKI